MEVLTTIFYVIIAILVLMLMITIHELGHYLTGKALGFKIKQFSIGFGKAIFKRTSQKTGEKFAIRIFPLGGFCEFEGEDEAGNESPHPQAFNNQKPWKRIIVLLGGAFSNFAVSILIIILVFLIGGMSFPSVAKNYEISYKDLEENPVSIEYILKVENSRLKEGDIIIGVGGKSLYLNGDLTKELSKFEVGEKISVTVIRDNKKIKTFCYKSYFVSPAGESGETSVYIGLGIGQGTKTHRLPFFETLGKSFVYAFKIAWAILSAFWQLITGQIGLGSVGGMTATIDITAEIARSGFRNFINIVAMIGINLAIFNVLPFPALDGGRVVFVGIEWIRKKPIKREIEAKIHTWGIIILLSMIVVFDISYWIIKLIN